MWLNYVFNNSSEAPQRLIEFVTQFIPPQTWVLGTSGCKFDGLKQNFAKKVGFSMEK